MVDKKIIITHSIENSLIKQYDAKLKKVENVAVIFLDQSNYEEIVQLYENTFVKENKFENVSFRQCFQNRS